MFVVVKRGVYRHEIWGCRSTLEEAKILACQKLETERDDYHTAEITIPTEDGEKMIGSLQRRDDRRVTDGSTFPVTFSYGDRSYVWEDV